jgi:NADPH-dependent ferric siderophore reductase
VQLGERISLTPRTVRLTLFGPSLVGLSSLPAQDVEVIVSDGLSPSAKRRYTIRNVRPERGEIDVDVVVHEHGGPGSSWAAQAEIGSHVELVGPCGKLQLLPAEWHLFVGDESSVPAISALCEALPEHEASAVVVQVGSHADLMSIASGDVRWVTRDGLPAGTVNLLSAAVGEVALPRVDARAYLLGESKVVAILRDALEERGLKRDRIFAKSYWRAGPTSPSERSA